MKKRSLFVLVTSLLISLFLICLLYFIQVAFKYTLVFDELITYMLFLVLFLSTIVLSSVYKTSGRNVKVLFICVYGLLLFVFIRSFICFMGDSTSRIFYDSPKGINHIELIQIPGTNSMTVQGYKVKWGLFKIGDSSCSTRFDEFTLLEYKAIWENENEVTIQVFGHDKTKEYRIKF